MLNSVMLPCNNKYLNAFWILIYLWVFIHLIHIQVIFSSFSLKYELGKKNSCSCFYCCSCLMKANFQLQEVKSKKSAREQTNRKTVGTANPSTASQRYNVFHFHNNQLKLRPSFRFQGTITSKALSCLEEPILNTMNMGAQSRKFLNEKLLFSSSSDENRIGVTL